MNMGFVESVIEICLRLHCVSFYILVKQFRKKTTNASTILLEKLIVVNVIAVHES